MIDRIKRNKGFTLIELMVAISISLIVTMFLISFFFANRTTFKAIDSTHKIQNTAQFVFDSMTKDVRSAGYMGCSANSDFYNVLSSFQSGNADWSNLRQPVVGYYPGSYHSLMVDAVSDAFSITSADMERSAIVKYHAATNQSGDSTFLLSGANPFKAEEQVVVSDCSTATIFKIGKVTNDTTSYNSSGNCAIDGFVGLGASCNTVVPRNYTFSNGSMITGLRSRGYYVAPSVDDANRNSLYLIDFVRGTEPEEIAENVDKMVVNYGVDTNSDGVANRFLKAADVNDWSQVIAIEVELLFKAQDSNVTINPQTYFIDGELETATDRNLYRSYKTFIALRNKAS